MSSFGGGGCHHIMKENALMRNTIEILDDEKQNILSEVLKCDVCLELPKGKQVRICEKGHHFCLSCHNKMKFCGICRGNLLKSRNFVVEQLVTKLGPLLGLPKHKLPPVEPSYNLKSGSFRCLHQCAAKMPAFQMISHLRARHPTNLIDDVRSNPYSGRFSFSYEVRFVQDEKYILSAQVSDMGLFTVELVFSGLDFFGFVRMLGDKTVSSLFRYQLIAKVPNARSDSFLEFGVTDCPVPSYLDDMESIKREGNGLSIQGEILLEYIKLENAIPVFFSVWKKSGNKKESAPSMICIPERHLFFKNDRKTRRNRNRNMRRKRLKEKLKNSTSSEEKSKVLTERFSELTL